MNNFLYTLLGIEGLPFNNLDGFLNDTIIYGNNIKFSLGDHLIDFFGSFAILIFIYFVFKTFCPKPIALIIIIVLKNTYIIKYYNDNILAILIGDIFLCFISSFIMFYYYDESEEKDDNDD